MEIRSQKLGELPTAGFDQTPKFSIPDLPIQASYGASHSYDRL